jgi:hypothetical protein
MTKGRWRKKRRYPLLVGKQVTISDRVSGWVDTVNQGSHAIDKKIFKGIFEKLNSGRSGGVLCEASGDEKERKVDRVERAKEWDGGRRN